MDCRDKHICNLLKIFLIKSHWKKLTAVFIPLRKGKFHTSLSPCPKCYSKRPKVFVWLLIDEPMKNHYHHYHSSLGSNWLFTLVALMPETHPGLCVQCLSVPPSSHAQAHTTAFYSLNLTRFKILTTSFALIPGYICETMHLTSSILLTHRSKG